MTPLDILFWLLAILLGGMIWAIEQGLGLRYRVHLVSSIAATLGSMLFVMFWIDDQTKIIPAEEKRFKTTVKMQEARGLNQEIEVVAKDPRSGGKAVDKSKQPSFSVTKERGGKAVSMTEAIEAMSQGITINEADGPEEEEVNGDVYSREPFTDCPTCPSMVIVPKGVSQIGSPVTEQGRLADEHVAETTPVAKPFAIGRLEILRGEYEAFVKETQHESAGQCDAGKRRGKFDWKRPGFEQDERHPVVCLSAADVRIYLAWLSEKAGRTYRLPTEVEWEHAARAHTTTPYWAGATIDRARGNVGRSRDGTTVGGLFAMNPWGLSDVAGNVWEMTSYCMPSAEGAAAGNAGEAECRRLVKGGGWGSSVQSARHAARAVLVDGHISNSVGFRVVREVDDRDKDKLLTKAQLEELAKADLAAAEINARETAAREEAARKSRETAAALEAAAAADKAEKAKKAAAAREAAAAAAIEKMKKEKEKEATNN